MHKKRRIFYWVLVGIFLSIATASMIVTRDGGLQQFYDDGYVRNIEEDWRLQAFVLGQYDSGNKSYVWTEGGVPCYARYYNWTEEIKYLQIDATCISGEGAVWRIFYRDNKENELAVQDVALKNGKTIIPIKPIEGSLIRITLACAEDTEYQIHSMQLTEYEENVALSSVICAAVLCFVFYMIMTGIMILIQKRRSKKSCDRSFGVSLETLAEEMTGWLSCDDNVKGYASYIRVLLIIAIVLTWKVVRGIGYGYTVLLTIVLFLMLVAWIPKEQKSVRKNQYILAAWIGTCAVQFISNLVLKKNFSETNFSELWILLCFGLLYHAWGRMKKPERLLEEFASAMEILCVGNLFYCIFGDAYKYETSRMTGSTSNPNSFSIQLMVFFCVQLFRLYQCVKYKKGLKYWLFSFLGLGAGVWMLYEAECRTAWMMLAGIVLVFGLFLVAHVMRNVTRRRKKQILALVLGLAVVAVIAGVLFGRNLFETRTFVTISFNSFFSGRPAVWLEYLGKTNLLGHWDNLYFDGTLIYAHSEVIVSMYKYGIAAGIFVMIFWAETLWATGKKCRKNLHNEYNLLAAMMLLAYLLPAGVETMNEKPMILNNWFAVYFIIGYIIQEKRVEIAKNDGE